MQKGMSLWRAQEIGHCWRSFYILHAHKPLFKTLKAIYSINICERSVRTAGHIYHTYSPNIWVLLAIKALKMALTNKILGVLLASSIYRIIYKCVEHFHWYKQLNGRLGSGRSQFNQVKKLLSALPMCSVPNTKRRGTDWFYAYE